MILLIILAKLLPNGANPCITATIPSFANIAPSNNPLNIFLILLYVL